MSTSAPSVVFVIVDSSPSSSVAQPGQPPTTAAAWQVPVAAGQTDQEAVAAFVTTQNFPLSSRVYMVDAATVQQFSITASLQKLSAPGAPTNVTAKAQAESAMVKWADPASDGGSPITAWEITPYVNGVAQSSTIVPDPKANKEDVTGLTDGTAYTFTVTAINGVGASPESTASAAVTPLAAPTVPFQVTGVVATPGPGQATVQWTAPNNGGDPISDYNVTPYIDGVAQAVTNVTGSPPATQATVTGLQNGTAYTFTVTAVNAIGPGAASAPSSPVTPG